MAAARIPADTNDSTHTLLGTVIKLKKDNNYGFIKPATDLPCGFSQKDVFFSLWVVSENEVEEGDIVEFLLKEGSNDKPEACAIWVCFRAEKDSQNPQDAAVHVEDGDHPTQGAAVHVQVAAVETPGIRAPRAAAVQVQGRVCGLLHNGNGFLELQGEVPAEFEDFKDIYFHKDWVLAGELELLVGDTLQFDISRSTRRADELTAHKIKLVACRARSAAAIDTYLLKLTGLVQGLTQADSQLLLPLLRCEAAWGAVGRCWAMTPDTISRLLQLLAALHSRTQLFPQLYTQLLHTLTCSHFCSSHSGCFRLYIQQAWAPQQQDTQQQDTQQAWTPIQRQQQALVRQFLLLVLELLPGKARTVAALIKSTLPPGTDSMQHFLYSVIKRLSAQHLDDLSEFEWSELPLVPSAAELLSPLQVSENMQPARPHGPYESVEQYVDTYFRLLRADCFSRMRSGIQDFLKNDLDPRDMNIYSEISLVSVRITNVRNGLTLGLKVKPREKIDDWKTCCNLQFGNLVCLSPTGTFTDPIWATVIERNPELLNSQQVVWVELCSESNCRDDSSCISDLLEASGRTILAESPTYYIAYQPILKTLQKSDTKTLAFQQELVNLEPPVPPASYNAAATEPPVPLDESQHDAFTQALSQRIGIIQGPPGTGKTFLGILLIQHLLQQQPDRPILVLTYKNHALDEFLKAVLRFLPHGVARVGGRSQEPAMDRCNLQTLKRETRRSQDNYKQKLDLMAEVNQVKVLLTDLIHKLHNATQFSVNTLLTEFDVDQVQDLIYGATLYDLSSGTQKLVDESEVKAVFDKNKEILLDTETSMEEKLEQLDALFMDFLLQALEQWLPAADAQQEIMKGEEVLSQLITSHSRTKTPKKERPADAERDEEDVEAEEKERLAAVWLPRYETEVTVRFEDMERSGACLGPAARRLAARVPLLAVRGVRELWGLSGYQRALVVQVVLWYQKEAVQQQLTGVMGRYKRLLAALRELEDQHRVAVLQHKQVIGMTVTGASIHHYLLQALRPPLVLVEEAAALMEPQLMAVLGDWVQHLILIGDHQQLRPPVDCHLLGRDYHLDLSLMQRLINNNYPYSTLHQQHRMPPSMAALLLDIYPHLTTSPQQHRTPPAFLPPVYFWAHEDAETVDRSYSNVLEAERVVRLALLFLQQGYKVTQVTVLAAYQAQVRLLRALLRQAVSDYPQLFPEHRDPYQGLLAAVRGQQANQKPDEEDNIKVSTIDGYQGDENEIIIVSLVRSNREGNIGFLRTINRRCVAQSRARCGMYLVGNVPTLLRAPNSCWMPLIRKLNEQRLVGMTLPLHCRDHGTTLRALTADHIPLTGLCNHACHQLMEPGLHSAARPCQADQDQGEEEGADQDQDDTQSKLDVADTQEEEEEVTDQSPSESEEEGEDQDHAHCEVAHQDIQHEEDGAEQDNRRYKEEVEDQGPSDQHHARCEVDLAHHHTQNEEEVADRLPQGDPAQYKEEVVDQDQDQAQCDQGHSLYEEVADPDDTWCEEKEEFQSPTCDHVPDEDHPQCEEEVEFVHPTCGHLVSRMCYQSEQDTQCEEEVQFLHPTCGHLVSRMCYQSDQDTQCEEEVQFLHPTCGHLVSRMCYQSDQDTQCEEEVQFLHPTCGHLVSRMCYQSDQDPQCEAAVEFLHPTCGHLVSRMCYQSDQDTQCEEKVQFLHPTCGHLVSRMCHQPEAGTPCSEPCAELMPCGLHPCNTPCQPPHPHPAAGCTVPVPYRFPGCGHVLGSKPCGQDAAHLLCAAKVPFKFPACGHVGIRRCWEQEQQLVCRTMCTQLLSCGHPCEGLCEHSCQDVSCIICTHEANQQPHCELLVCVEDVTQHTDPADKVTKQPDCVDKVTVQPDCVDKVTVQPDCVDKVTVQPDCVDKVTVQPDCVDKVTVQPECVDKVTVQPECVDKVTVQPECVDKVTVQPECVDKVTVQPECVDKVIAQSDKVTEQPDKVTEQPDRVDKVIAQPDKVTEQPDKVTVQPDCVDKVTKQPDMVTVQPDKVTVQPDRVDKVTKQLEYVDKVTEQPDKVTVQPDRVDKVTKQLEYVDKVTEQPDRVDKVTVQPDSMDKVTKQPDKVTEQPDKVAEQPDRVDKVTVQPDSMDKVTKQADKVPEQPGCVKKVTKQPDCVQETRHTYDDSKDVMENMDFYALLRDLEESISSIDLTDCTNVLDKSYY